MSCLTKIHTGSPSQRLYLLNVLSGLREELKMMETKWTKHHTYLLYWGTSGFYVAMTN